MPNRSEHLDAAIVVGLLLALLMAEGDSLSAVLAEAVGVILGCALGGLLPDGFEPGTSSWHRKSFHSLAALAGIASLSTNPPERLTRWREDLHQQGQELRAGREHLPADHPRRTDLWLSETVRYLLAGATIGLPAGYACHLLMDAGTPRGLPAV